MTQPLVAGSNLTQPDQTQLDPVCADPSELWFLLRLKTTEIKTLTFYSSQNLCRICISKITLKSVLPFNTRLLQHSINHKIIDYNLYHDLNVRLVCSFHASIMTRNKTIKLPASTGALDDTGCCQSTEGHPTDWLPTNAILPKELPLALVHDLHSTNVG